MTAVTVALDVLAACERVADGPEESPQGAFVLWLVAQAQGWDQARLRVSRSVWYRHLNVLRAAGLEVPTKHRRRHEASSIRELDSGAGLLRMVGKRFALLQTLSEFEPVGARGTVLQILFRKSRWMVGVKFDGSPGSYEELCVGEFARMAEWVTDEDR